MVTRRPRVAFICDEEVKKILEQWADEEGRTVSNLVERIVLEVITTKGKTLAHQQVKKASKSRDRSQPQPPTASKANGKGRSKKSQPQTTKESS